MVKLENVVKEYKDFNLNVSMEIKPGTIVGLIGKNGSGKSTTIKSILGLIKPNSGQITVFGKKPSELLPIDKAKLGVALADGGFSVYLKVKDIAAVESKLYADFDKNLFLEKCQDAELPLNKPIKEFSTGMAAKLRVLLALSHNANLLILDEPTAGLDVGARNEILDILREYMTEDENRAILITSHISTDLEGLCDEIYLIDKGKLILHEETDTIISEYGLLKVSNEVYEKIDKEHILRTKDESFGKACLTSQFQYYKENYPDIVIERVGIDELILMLTGGN